MKDKDVAKYSRYKHSNKNNNNNSMTNKKSERKKTFFSNENISKPKTDPNLIINIVNKLDSYKLFKFIII